MAYNNFFPTGYQPYYQTNQLNTPINQFNAPTQQSGIVWVQGEAAAKSYPIAPNTSVALWDSEANVVYIKSADASGMPSMKIIDYTMRDNAVSKPEISRQSEFATKDDLLPIKKEIEALKAKIGGERDGE